MIRYLDEVVGYLPIKKRRIEVEVKGREHNPPHVHIKIDDNNSGLFEIKDGSKYRGNMEGKYLRLIKAWVLANRDMLKREWNKRNPMLWMDVFGRRRGAWHCQQNGCETFSIHPLRFRFSSKMVQSGMFRKRLFTDLSKALFRSACRMRALRRLGVSYLVEKQYCQAILVSLAQI